MPTTESAEIAAFVVVPDGCGVVPPNNDHDDGCGVVTIVVEFVE